MGSIRNPKSLAPVKELVSPYEVDGVYAQFTIKKATNREDVERMNFFARLEYVQSDVEGEAVTRRELPMGDLQVRTILLCLVKWDILNEKENPVPINQQTLLDYLLPEERIWLYEQVLEFNPIWQTGVREATKSESD